MWEAKVFDQGYFPRLPAAPDGSGKRPHMLVFFYFLTFTVNSIIGKGY